MLDTIDASRSRVEVHFSGIDRLKAVKIIDCETKESVEFLKRTINVFADFWPGAKLEVIPQSSLPLRPVVSVWIHPPVLETENFLRLLAGQNVGISTLVWEVLSTTAADKAAGLDIRIAVDVEPLELLRVNGGGCGWVSELSGSVTPPSTRGDKLRRLRMAQINLHHCEVSSANLLL